MRPQVREHCVKDTKEDHMASLQSASSCTSYAGIVSLMYNNTPPPLLPILSFLNIAYPSSPNSAYVISLFAHYSVIPIICGCISSTIMFNSFFLFIILLAYAFNFVFGSDSLYFPLHLLSSCTFLAFFDKLPCPTSLNIVLYPSRWRPPLTVPRQKLLPP